MLVEVKEAGGGRFCRQGEQGHHVGADSPGRAAVRRLVGHDGRRFAPTAAAVGRPRGVNGVAVAAFHGQGPAILVICRPAFGHGQAALGHKGAFEAAVHQVAVGQRHAVPHGQPGRVGAVQGGLEENGRLAAPGRDGEVEGLVAVGAGAVAPDDVRPGRAEPPLRVDAHAQGGCRAAGRPGQAPGGQAEDPGRVGHGHALLQTGGKRGRPVAVPADGVEAGINLVRVGQLVWIQGVGRFVNGLGVGRRRRCRVGLLGDPGGVDPGFVFAGHQVVQPGRAGHCFPGRDGEAGQLLPDVEPGEVAEDAHLPLMHGGQQNAEPGRAGGDAPQHDFFLVVEGAGRRPGAVGHELGEPGVVGQVLGFVDAAVLFVEDVGPAQLVDDHDGVPAGGDGMGHIRHRDNGGIGRVGPLVGGAVQDLAVLFIGHVQAVGFAEGQGNALPAVDKAYLEMVAAAG